MNITFLILIILIVISVYLLRNLLKIRTGRIHGFLWLVHISIILMLLEALLTVSGRIQFLPHFLFITFPIRFLIVPLLILISLKVSQYQNIPYFLKKGFAIPSLLGFLVLVPVYSLDTANKIIFIDHPTNIILVLIWGLFVSNMFFMIRLSGELKTLFQQKHLHIWCLTIGLMGFQFIQLFATLETKLIPFFDLASSLFVGIALIFFRLFHSRASSDLSTTDLLKKINEVIIDQKLFLRPDLNLRMLSDHLGRTPNEISKAINSGLSMSFSDLINEHRVNEFIQLMQDKNNNKFTLEGISKMAGFNSTTSFNKVFKKVTGKTPREYKMMTES